MSSAIREGFERRRLWREVDRSLEGVTFPVPFDVRAFCAAVSVRVGRPIRLRPMSALMTGDHPPFSGLWIPLPPAHYVFYDDTTSTLHGDNTILHEIGHLIFGHRSSAELGPHHLEMLHRLLPEWTVGELRTLGIGVMGRCGHTRDQERVAELFAERIWELAGRIGLMFSHQLLREHPDDQALWGLARALGPGSRT